MTLQECIKKMGEMFRAKANIQVNGYGIILEPLNGDSKGWKFKIRDNRWCYASIRTQYAPDKVGQFEEWNWDIKTHRIRYYVDFFNRLPDVGGEFNLEHPEALKMRGLQKYILQRSMFKNAVVKAPFKHQLTHGAMFDMHKVNWGTILCTGVALRNVHEYRTWDMFEQLKAAGIRESVAFLLSGCFRKIGNIVDFEARGGHGLTNGADFTIQSLIKIVQGEGPSIDGCASAERIHTSNTRHMNVVPKGEELSSWFIRIRGGGEKIDHDPWGVRGKKLSFDDFVKEARKLEKQAK